MALMTVTVAGKTQIVDAHSVGAAKRFGLEQLKDAVTVAPASAAALAAYAAEGNDLSAIPVLAKAEAKPAPEAPQTGE